MPRSLYAALLRRQGEIVTVGHGVACYGSADRYLGMAAATSGRMGDARRHLDVALAVNARMGARTWLAHTEHVYGRLLLDEEPERARALLAAAASTAADVGMPALLARIRAAGGGGPALPLPDDLSPREVQILALVARGRSNREIGLELVISQHTVANHVRSILRKTRCANRTEAAAYAHRNGIAG